ncbi:MAG: NADH-quinone oxidoreductase subunit H, partial [Gemmatimonas sp.]|nr:NADH-quinone oxidoreductase subunit H [Gemmatimonas sp.]
LIIEDLPAGLFFALAASSVGVIGVLMAGWASNNKYALMGGLRAAAQLIAYELPLVLAALVVAVVLGALLR